MKKKSALLFLLITFSILSFAQKSKAYELLHSANKDYILVAAHRGEWTLAPENSIPALEYSIQFGVDIMETDVRLTKDGQIVIMHDYTVDRTTNGTGKVSDLTLAEIKKLKLRNNSGGMTDLEVPTLEEYIKIAKGKIILYLDKAGYDLPNHQKGHLIKKLIETVKKHDYLQETMLVLDMPYSQAKAILGNDLEKINYVPVIEESISNLNSYVDEYLTKLKPVAFQFRIADINSESYKQLDKILKSSSKAFVAATWKNHTAGHDDLVSILERPSKGWGWIVEKGFTILETNYPRDLIKYLEYENRR